MDDDARAVLDVALDLLAEAADLPSARRRLPEIIALLDTTVVRLEASLDRAPQASLADISLRDRARKLATKLRGREPRSGPLDAARVLAIARTTFVGQPDVFVAPDIPEAKRRGAEKKYVTDLGPDENLLALIDLTVFGGATDGVAILERRFIHRYISKDRLSVPYLRLIGGISSATTHFVHLPDMTRLDLLTPTLASAFAEFLRAIAAASAEAHS